MKAVLISIQPKWCELIASGKKTVEVRKTRPKIEAPFKCYIYCTHGDALAVPCLNNPRYTIHRANNGTLDGKRMTAEEREKSDHSYGNGKVIGEFVCDRLSEYECSSDGFGELATTCGTCLIYDEIINYCNGNKLYGWRITDLVIYDKPRELGEFFTALSDKDIRCKHKKMRYTVNGIRYYKCTLQNSICEFRRLGCQTDCDGYETLNPSKPITRPPQSWCYVEGLR